MAPMASAVISLGFIYLGDPRRRLCRTNSAYADALSSTEIINGHQVMTESMKILLRMMREGCVLHRQCGKTENRYSFGIEQKRFQGLLMLIYTYMKQQHASGDGFRE